MSDSRVDILLVDDNEEDAELITRTLSISNSGSKILHCINGQEALNYIFCKGEYSDRNILEKPRLILLDIKMPKVDGLEVLRQIKNDQRTKVIPVVMLTSSKEDRDINESYSLGASSYVVKAVQFDRFFKSVSEVSDYWLTVNQAPK